MKRSSPRRWRSVRKRVWCPSVALVCYDCLEIPPAKQQRRQRCWRSGSGRFVSSRAGGCWVRPRRLWPGLLAEADGSYCFTVRRAPRFLCLRGRPSGIACPRVWRSLWILTLSSFDQEGSSGKPKPSFRRTTCSTMLLISSIRITTPPRPSGFQRQPCQLTSVVVPERAVRSTRPWLRLR